MRCSLMQPEKAKANETQQPMETSGALGMSPETAELA